MRVNFLFEQSDRKRQPINDPSGERSYKKILICPTWHTTRGIASHVVKTDSIHGSTSLLVVVFLSYDTLNY